MSLPNALDFLNESISSISNAILHKGECPILEWISKGEQTKLYYFEQWLNHKNIINWELIDVLIDKKEPKNLPLLVLVKIGYFLMGKFNANFNVRQLINFGRCGEAVIAGLYFLFMYDVSSEESKSSREKFLSTSLLYTNVAQSIFFQETNFSLYIERDKKTKIGTDIVLV